MKKIEIAFLIITSLIVIGFTVGIYHASVDRESEKFQAAYPMSITMQIPAAYLAMFRDDAKAKLLPINTFNEKAKFPIANIDYDSTYCIQVYKLSSTWKSSLPDGIIDNNSDGRRPVKTMYTANQESSLAIMDKLGPLDTPSTILFSLHGDQKQQIIRNDTVLCYHTKYRSFSVRYSKAGKQQLCSDISESLKEPTFIEVLFLKKDRDLYFLVMSPEKKNTPLKPGMLYSLIKK